MIAYMNPNELRFVTLHCAATPEGRAHTAAEVCAWDVERFGQASYHWVIELDGTRVRCLPDDRKGAHVALHNTGNVGICYVGGLAIDGRTPKDTRTPEQIDSLKALVQAYKAKHPAIKVMGHRDWPNVHKACPCFDTSSWLRECGITAP